MTGPLNDRKCKVVFKDANGVVLNEAESKGQRAKGREQRAEKSKGQRNK